MYAYVEFLMGNGLSDDSRSEKDLQDYFSWSYITFTCEKLLMTRCNKLLADIKGYAL